MALETSGFQLSQFERAPQIPGNIGVVDTKSIYGSVVDALKANEALRTTQAVQAATDAELALAQQKAQTEMGLLGPEAEARRAKAQLFTAGAPFEMGLLESRAGAERAKLGYETALSGELAKPENIFAAAKAKTLSSSARGIYDLARMAADPTASKELRDAAGVKLKTVQDANQRFRTALDAGKVDFHTTNADGTTYVRFRDGSTGIIGFPETYTGNAAAYLSGPIAGGLGAPVTTGAVTPLVPAGTEEIPVGAFAPAATTGAPAATTGAPAARAPGVMLGGVAPGAGGVRAPTKAGLLATQSAVKFGGETSPLAGIEGDEVKKEALSTAAEMGKEARKEIRAQLTNLTSFQTEARKEDDIQKELDALIKDANEKGIMISGGSFFGRGLRALAPGEAKTFKSRLGSVIQFIQLGNMLKLKNASSTGSTGFGSLTEPENKLLQGDYGDLTEPDLPSESLVAGLERAKRGLALRRQEALDTIRGRLAVERGIEQQTSAFFQNAKDRFVIPRHPLEIQEQAAPTRPVLPSLEGVNLFPSRGAITPARLTIGPEPTPEPAPGPHTEGPLVPAPSLEGIEVQAVDGKPVEESGAVNVGRFRGTVEQPAPAPAPAAPAPAPIPAPERDANAPASPLLMNFIKRLGEVNPEVAQRRREMTAQTGGTSYAAAGPFAKPVEPAIPESNVRPVGQSTWEAYNERRRRATEAGLPQVALSPQGVAIARELRSQYEAGQRAKQGEQPVVEIMGSDGKRRAFAVEDPTIADALIGILTGQAAPNLEPRLEVDREATRRLGEERMRREELARQLRSIPRR